MYIIELLSRILNFWLWNKVLSFVQLFEKPLELPSRIGYFLRWIMSNTFCTLCHNYFILSWNTLLFIDLTAVVVFVAKVFVENSEILQMRN